MEKGGKEGITTENKQSTNKMDELRQSVKQEIDKLNGQLANEIHYGKQVIGADLEWISERLRQKEKPRWASGQQLANSKQYIETINDLCARLQALWLVIDAIERQQLRP